MRPALYPKIEKVVGLYKMRGGTITGIVVQVFARKSKASTTLSVSMPTPLLEIS
jgi:hypothetical protein